MQSITRGSMGVHASLWRVRSPDRYIRSAATPRPPPFPLPLERRYEFGARGRLTGPNCSGAAHDGSRSGEMGSEMIGWKRPRDFEQLWSFASL